MILCEHQALCLVLQKRQDRRALAEYAVATRLRLKLHGSWAEWRKYVGFRQQKHENKAKAAVAWKERLLYISFQTLKVTYWVSFAKWIDMFMKTCPVITVSSAKARSRP